MSALATQVFAHVTLIQPFCETAQFPWEPAAWSWLNFSLIYFKQIACEDHRGKKKGMKNTDEDKRTIIKRCSMLASRSHQRLSSCHWPCLSAVSVCALTVSQHILACVSLSWSELITRPVKLCKDRQKAREMERKEGKSTGGLNPLSCIFSICLSHSSLIFCLFCAAHFHPPCHGVSCLNSL